MIETKIREAKELKYVLPALFCTKDRSEVVLASFVDNEANVIRGVMLHPKQKFGEYSNSWAMTKFKRMAKTSEVSIKFIQE